MHGVGVTHPRRRHGRMKLRLPEYTHRRRLSRNDFLPLRIHISWIRMIKSILFLLSVTLLSGANPDPKTEKEVLAALDAYKQGLMKKDATTLSKILSDDLTYSHSSNLHENKAAVLESLKGNTVAEAIDFKNLKVRVYGNTALVKG